MINLVQNEMMKLVGKKKFLVVTLIILVLISMFTYAQYKEIQRLQERLGTTDWRTTVQQQIIDRQNRLTSSGISDEWKKQLKIMITQQQYYLDHNINPSEPGAPTFVRGFIEHAIPLFLPLMVMLISADLVSSEYSLGTIKLLLTRPVKRWKILLSKYISLILSVALIIAIFGVSSYLISGLVFGYQGFSAPILTGFSIEGNDLSTSNVYLIPQWQYLLQLFGLAWFVALVVATLSFMLSVVMRSTTASMGVMLALLISGMILTEMVSSWESAKYFFMVNLDVSSYLRGAAPPIEGMTLGFSLAVLSIWGLAGLAVAFLRFVKQDVY